MTHLKVAVRVRPLSRREIEAQSIPIVAIENVNTIAITNTKVPEQNAGDSRERIRRFTFDYCFHENSTQDDIFKVVENVIGKSIQRRHHSSVLAYGQSSSGKTHTMMGFANNQGLTPRLCEQVFNYFKETAVEGDDMKTTVSYLEIYNEKVRDLLSDKEHDKASISPTLRVREHPKKGPYVQGLIEHPVEDSASLLRWLHLGNGNRRVAATLTNPESSRSHSVFTVTCSGVKLNLVDLAGSERAGSRCYGTSRFKEGANINKSLVALGNVISALAEQTSKSTRSIRRRFVPYRDSVLTWLLKDTLGGNSNTVMIVTIAPSNACYNETVNTLRFGQRAKLIVSTPVVNEDPKEKIIRELRAEILKLRELLNSKKEPIENSMFEANSEENSNQNNQQNENPSSELHIEQSKEDEIQENDATKSINSDELLAISENLHVKATEKLIPVMDFTSSIKGNKQSETPKLRRTLSVEHPVVKSEPKVKMFGSHDEISSKKSNPLLRKKSIDNKPRKLLENTSKKLEKSVSTDSKPLLKVEAKVDSIRKPSLKPRSQIVAAVTNRLYAKSKKKEASTDTSDINKLLDEIPKELTICSNARNRLKELTRKALKAHRSKNEETQTDLYPVIRVKEISTDVDDLKISLMETKNVETATRTVETKNQATSCSLLENSSIDHQHCLQEAFIITRTCGAQLIKLEKLESAASKEHPSTVSFTKYLRDECGEPKFEISSAETANPIYTSSVNINISHNYINRVSDNSASEDGLNDHNRENVYFPTPDLISNHNSLEPHTHATETMESINHKIQYANSNSIQDQFVLSNELLEQNDKRLHVANSQITAPVCTEKISSLDIPIVYATEICLTSSEVVENCQNFYQNLPDFAKASIIDFKNCSDDCIKIVEPIVLKSIMKHLPECENNPDEVSEYSDKDLPDSLEYHMINHNKKVHFNKIKTPQPKDRMFTAMTEFLEEAKILMNNLSLTAKKIESKKLETDEFKLKVTIDDVSEIEDALNRKKRRKPETQSKTKVDAEIQTALPKSADFSHNEYIPTNKYTSILENSCKRLEESLNAAENKERISQNFSYNPWDLTEPNEYEDISLDSNTVTFSDYGSLPRRAYKRQRAPTCSPSAFLRQLTSMRRQVINSSREELLDNSPQ